MTGHRVAGGIGRACHRVIAVTVTEQSASSSAAKARRNAVKTLEMTALTTLPQPVT